MKAIFAITLVLVLFGSNAFSGTFGGLTITKVSFDRVAAEPRSDYLLFQEQEIEDILVEENLTKVSLNGDQIIVSFLDNGEEKTVSYNAAMHYVGYIGK